MLAAHFKRTKIMATIGPASQDYDTLVALIRAGVNGVRLNFSHNTQEWHAHVVKEARRASRQLNKPIALVQDLAGPKLRVGSLPGAGLALVRGRPVRFKHATNYEVGGVIPIQHDMTHWVHPGQTICLRDGQIEVVVEKVARGTIHATVKTPGILMSNQGINLPEADFGGDILTDKDLADLKFGVGRDFDYVALSFVQTAEDITNLKQRLEHLGSTAAVIAKVETRAAVANLEAIVAASDGVMVARGDLATETLPEAVPIVQERMVELARRYRKFVIVATQMLESMTTAPAPTRAEASDVARAAMEGADAVMTSGETAVGKFPVATIKMMKRILRYTGESIPYELKVNFNDRATQANAICAAAVILARQVRAKVIVAETTSGQTALNLASFRPPVPIMMVTDDRRVANQLALVWGGKAFAVKGMSGATDRVIEQLKELKHVAAGDIVVVASGRQPGVSGGTDTVRVKVVP